MLTLAGSYQKYLSSKDVLFAKVEAICDCGKKISCRLSHFKSGEVTSCGCAKITSTYLMYNPLNKLTKIGRTVNIKSRLKVLESQCGMKLENRHVFSKDIESLLHAKYSNKRKIGEWFNLSEDDISFIIQNF